MKVSKIDVAKQDLKAIPKFLQSSNTTIIDSGVISIKVKTKKKITTGPSSF
jgi:hypothetical protein